MHLLLCGLLSRNSLQFLKGDKNRGKWEPKFLGALRERQRALIHCVKRKEENEWSQGGVLNVLVVIGEKDEFSSDILDRLEWGGKRCKEAEKRWLQ